MEHSFDIVDPDIDYLINRYFKFLVVNSEVNKVQEESSRNAPCPADRDNDSEYAGKKSTARHWLKQC